MILITFQQSYVADVEVVNQAGKKEDVKLALVLWEVTTSQTMMRNFLL